MQIQQLLKNTDITHFRNNNAPKGCFVEVLRKEDKTITTFITHYPNGRTVNESADFKSSYLQNTAEGWVDYSKEGAEACKPVKQKDTLTDRINLLKKWLGSDVNKYNEVKLFMKGHGVELTSVDGWLSQEGDKSQSGIGNHIEEILTNVVGV